uniref:SUEL-type lectin domain-containing protein n=1 Tax=Xiphophorus maculatus TaxID=8083 RepID=A0A3B5PTB0_XIPMA
MFLIFIQMKFVLFTLFLCGFILEINVSENLLFCFQHFLFALAEEGQAIYVTSATYGRSNRFTCYVGIPAEQTKNTDCATRAESVCEGRSACNVLASSAVFGDPCVGTYKYLDVIYLCFQHFLFALAEEGQAIYVTSATYGRTDKKTCSARRPADQLKNTECFTYAEEVGERCNGKQWCKVKASNYVFGDPCYGTYKYLEVEYICYGIKTVVACEGSEAQISCGKDIFVISAIYGRSNRLTCSVGIPAEQTKKTHCATKAVCEGKSTCNVLASSSVFGDPCVGTYKYLDVIYLC